MGIKITLVANFYFLNLQMRARKRFFYDENKASIVLAQKLSATSILITIKTKNVFAFK